IIAEIIEQLNQMIKTEFSNHPQVHIIDDYDIVHMARLAIHFGFSTNGVSELHTEILKETELHDFYKIYPEEFSNKTNGITFRRWLMAANPELTAFLDRKIGTKWHKDANLKALLDYQKDEEALRELKAIKYGRKVQLKNHLERTKGVKINSNSIIDIQIKRIHEYKRDRKSTRLNSSHVSIS